MKWEYTTHLPWWITSSNKLVNLGCTTSAFLTVLRHLLLVTCNTINHCNYCAINNYIINPGLSMRPEYNGKIATGVLLGPSVFLANSFNGLLSYFYFTAKIVDVSKQNILVSIKLLRKLTNFIHPGHFKYFRSNPNHITLRRRNAKQLPPNNL